MSSKSIVAIVAAVAAVLSLAAPVAAQSDTLPGPHVVQCDQAIFGTGWRFLSATRHSTGDTAPTSDGVYGYDFVARANRLDAYLTIHVEQYVPASSGGREWRPMLTTVQSGLGMVASGSTTLHPGRWTDVYVRCAGAVRAEVTLEVTRRQEVLLAGVSPHTFMCNNQTQVWRFRSGFEAQYDIEARATSYRYDIEAADHVIDVEVQQQARYSDEWWTRLYTGSFFEYGRPGRAHGSVILGRPDDWSALISIGVSCFGSEEGQEVILRVTKREEVTLRRKGG